MCSRMLLMGIVIANPTCCEFRVRPALSLRAITADIAAHSIASDRQIASGALTDTRLCMSITKKSVALGSQGS